MSSLPYYLLAGLTFVAYKYMWENAWLFSFLLYALLPLCDEVFSLDIRNPT